MSQITSRVNAALNRAIARYGSEITIVDRNNNEYTTRAIPRRPAFVETLDSTVMEYYFILSTAEFERIKAGIGGGAVPAPFFGRETIKYRGDTYVLRTTEPYEYYDGERQSIRLWGTKLK